MLSSGDIDQVDYALVKLPLFNVSVFRDDILRLVSNSSSYVANRVLSKLPSDWYLDYDFTLGLLDRYGDLHYHSRELILKKMVINNNLPPAVIDGLITLAANSNEEHFVLILGVIFNQTEISAGQEKSLVKLAKEKQGRIPSTVCE